MITRSPIIRLVQTAAEQHTLEGIKQMLHVVAEELDGWGALVWLAGPNSDPAIGTGRLFVLGYWVADEHIRVWHELNFNSATGYVLKTKTPLSISLDDPRNATPTPRLVAESKTRHFCLAPMTMEGGSDAVLEVYRIEDKPFSPTEVDLLEQMAAILPALYANLTDRVDVDLVDEVSEILRAADQRESVQSVCQDVVDQIDKVFGSLHLSILLEAAERPGRCNVVAFRKVWEGPWTEKSEYSKGEGATGYVFEHGRTVRIVDLARYEEDRAWIEDHYPGLQWKNSLRLQRRAKEYFGLSDSEPSPPLSWIGAPIRGGTTTFGVIRCSGARRNPFYFDEWQARVLEGVGIEIGAWWQNALRQSRKDQEIRSWERLVQGFHDMNRFVQKQLGQRVWNEAVFFNRAMDLAHGVIPRTENSDVRLVAHEELVRVAAIGEDWKKFPDARNARERINPPGSAAACVVAEKKGVQVWEDAREAPYFRPRLQGTRKLICAPIEAGDTTYGVLSIRSKSDEPFPPNAGLMAGLLGQQLGIYHSLALQIRSLQEAEGKNRALIETQARTIGDVHHQVKSPIIAAHRTAQDLIDSGSLPLRLRPDVDRMKGLCSKVARVVRNMGMFSDLSSQKPIRLKKIVLKRERVLQMLRESCGDHETLVDPDRQITFKVDDKGFQDLAGKDMVGKLVEADAALLEQCVNNLLDNAAKYSFDRTEVRVSGGVQAKGSEFFIGIANQGFEVKPGDVPKLKQRGHRADQAISATAEGSGIGLWIVNEIMKAHGGSLAITPTVNGITDVRLVFPVVKGVEKLSDEAQDSVSRR